MTNNMNEMGKSIKNNISALIEKGNISQAVSLITQFESIIQDDPDIYSMKAVIAMVEGNLDDAELLIKQGLEIEEEHFDLLYNLAYLYHTLERIGLSIEYYKKAMIAAKDQNEQDAAYEGLKAIDPQISKEAVLKSRIPKTSIVVLTYNNLQYNKVCIESIRKYTKKDSYEIVVVDNYSTDGTVEWLMQQKDVKTIFNKENAGFPKGCNQGIEIAEKGNDILLLNNDIIVMPNWLENLQKCLYSSEKIGAVGAITNSCSNYQVISLPYDNFDDIFKFAQQHNISNPALWEERLRMVGFCMLIKNEVVQKIGVLDERFTPGNFEDDDYSLRIRQAGYRLMLCKDAFIYHFGSISFSKEKEKYSDVLVNNRKKFIDKWRIDPYNIMDIRKDITQIVKLHAFDCMNILQIDCAGGGTLLDIKNEIPTANLYGITKEIDLIANTQHFADIKVGDIQIMKKFPREFFDFVIISELQNSRKELINILCQIQLLLKKNARVMISLSKQVNLNYAKEVEKEITDHIGNSECEFIENTNENLLYITKIQNQGKNIRSIQAQQIKVTILNKDSLSNTDDTIDERELTDEKLVKLLRRIENEIEFEKNMGILSNAIQRGTVDENKIVRNIINRSIDKEKMLNLMAAVYARQEPIHKALVFLMEAYKMNPNNHDTIYNIALIIYQLGDKETALKYIEKADAPEEDLLELKQEIMGVKL